MFTVGGVPFNVLVRMSGGGDLVVKNPSVGICAQAESVRLVALLLDFPL